MSLSFCGMASQRLLSFSASDAITGGLVLKKIADMVSKVRRIDFLRVERQGGKTPVYLVVFVGRSFAGQS